MRKRENNNVIIEDEDIIDIIFPNFQGAPDKFNPNGQMGNAWLVFEKGNQKVEELIEKGFNVREFVTSNDYDPDSESTELRLQVFVRFDNYPPKITLINQNDEKTMLDSNTMIMLDSALSNGQVERASFIISPYTWEFGGRNGVKAYVRAASFRIFEMPFTI